VLGSVVCEGVHHERQFESGYVGGGTVSGSEVQTCYLSIRDGDCTLADRLGILSAGDGSDGQGHKFATIGLPEVDNVSVLLGIERYSHGHFGECARTTKVEDTSTDAIGVLGCPSGITDSAEVGEVVLERGRLDPIGRLADGLIT
jgi:hypothetical protein